MCVLSEHDIHWIAIVQLDLNKPKFSAKLYEYVNIAFHLIPEADSCKDNDFFNFYHQELLSEFSELKKMLQNIAHGNILQKEIYREGESQISNWYEWEDLRKKLDRLDTDKNQYILIVDKLSEEEDTSLRILKNVNWKVVVDVDPNSDNGGLLTQFKSVGATISTLLPNQLRGANTENLLQSNSIQWLQANGRSIELTDDQKANAAEVSQYNKDEPKDTIDNWERHFRVPCQEVIRTMGKKFDDMKLTYCLILGIRCGLSSEIATLISKDIRGQFEYMGHEINFVSIDSELALSNFPNLTCSDLSISHFLIGLAGLCGNSLVTKYSLPTGVKDCPVTLSPKHFSALNEYMEVLYHSCEDIPEGLDDAELESFEKQHLKNFISGSTITLQSLHFQHDARRDLTKEIYDDILSSYKAAQMAKIIQIKHTPGSGGTTLARRVLWDLHERLPCVIIRMDCALKNFGQYSYGETYIENLCKRISKLQSICKVSPVILMDGNSTQVSTLSSCVARKLRNTPLFILCCVKHKPRPGVKKPRKEQSKKEKSKKESNDDLFRREFELDYRLDRKSPEYSELKKIYQCYRTQFPEDSQTSTKLRERVFHFPMLALLGDFKKLSSIVSDSLDILKMHKEKEYEIAIVVAFLQQFGDVTTPVSLISKYILKSKKSYEKLASQFDENLMNLMVPGKPPGGKKFIANNYFKSSDDDDEETQQQCVIEYYTFQHHQVADAVLKYCQRSLHEITKDFLDYEILVCYRENKEITYVIDQLFLYHEAQNETHFSKLVSKLADWKRKKPEKNAQKNHKEEHDVEGFNVEEKNEEAEEYNEDESDAEEYYVMEKTAAARNEVVKSAEEKNVVEKNEEEKNEKDDNGNKKEGKNADQIEFDVGKIFEDAAEQTKDATFYSHVARFFSYNGNFVKARELIEKGMEVESNIPADRKRRIFDTYGYIVLKEMRSKNIKDIDDLQRDAEEAFTLFRKAKEIHPRNFPNPLIGTVKVWQFCFEYLIKEYENDVKKVIELTVEDGFFSNSIATCIDLLNEVDDMVKELQLLPDAERTKGLADWQRYMLAETFGKAKSATTRSGLGEVNFFRICEFIRSYKDTASQKYLIRLQAMWLISKVKRDFTRLEEMEKKQLFSWLEKLVIEHEMFSLTREMLDVAAIQNKPQIQIDRAFKIIEDWQDRYPNDHFSFFYQYMLCFIKICEGKITDHKARYESSLANCKKWTEDNMRRYQNQFFISKDRKEICKLLSHSQVLLMYKKSKESKSKDDKLDNTFWKSHARHFLLECRGRVQFIGGKDRRPCITLEPGNIRISVRPNELGASGIEYNKDTKVRFLVAFTLAGPKAEAVIIEG